MRAALEMMLMRAMAASAARDSGRKRKKADGRKLVCAVCHTYGGTMYSRGDGYICRDCKRKEQKNDRKTD